MVKLVIRSKRGEKYMMKDVKESFREIKQHQREYENIKQSFGTISVVKKNKIEALCENKLLLTQSRRPR